MIRLVGSRNALLVLLAAVALIAFACQGSNSPTAPVAETGSTLTQVSAAAHAGDEAVRLWATMMAEPKLVWDNDGAWVRLVVECSHSESGPASMAVFRCEGELLDRCMALTEYTEFLVLARYAGLDGVDHCPLWNVIKLRRWDH